MPNTGMHSTRDAKTSPIRTQHDDHELSSEAVAAVLSVKRHEHPTEDYFERFVDEFHRKQAWELVNRPLWKLVVDRFSAWLGEAGLAHAARVSAAGAFAFAVALMSWQTLVQPNFDSPNSAGMESVSYAGLDPEGEASPNNPLVLHIQDRAMAEQVMNLIASSTNIPQPQLPQGLGAETPQHYELAINLPRNFLSHQAVEQLNYISAVDSVIGEGKPRYVIDPQPVSYEAVLAF
ncbi:MAG: hypothetical protein ACFCU3_12455 [Verrucomicrobiales bacterium]